MTNIWCKDAGQIIVIMVTHNPDPDMLKPSPVLEFLEEQEILLKNHFLFNNRDIYEKPMTVILNTTYLAKLQFEIKKYFGK